MKTLALGSFGAMRSLRSPLLALSLALLMGGCASSARDLTALDRRIEVDRFMGDWYVLGFIPIDLPFFSEANAHDAVENYQLNGDGRIDVTYTFRDGGFDEELKTMKQRARVFDEDLGTEWRVQFVWPFESPYLIAWLSEDYDRAIVGVPSRSNVWILSRSSSVSESDFADLAQRVSDLGYDSTLLRRVPHRTRDRESEGLGASESTHLGRIE
jgi:apolipoprotein D and lipocalin family protein